jgi:hypothetical protein
MRTIVGGCLELEADRADYPIHRSPIHVQQVHIAATSGAQRRKGILTEITLPTLGSPEPRKPQPLLTASGAEQDPQAIMQNNIKTKAGPEALARVQQYLASTGHPDAAHYTKLFTDGPLVYRYDLSMQDWKFTETEPGGTVPEVVDQKEICSENFLTSRASRPSRRPFKGAAPTVNDEVIDDGDIDGVIRQLILQGVQQWR